MNDPKFTPVRITPEEKQRYIHAYVVREGNNKTSVIWGDPDVLRHGEILDQLGKAGYRINYVDGGGRIQILPESKAIYFWDYSADFGRVHHEVVEKCLKGAFPDYTIHADQWPPGHDTRYD